jgi:FkbM family methyltransferase
VLRNATITSIVNILLRKAGLEVHRIQYGRDAVRDAGGLIGSGPDTVIFDVGANRGQSIKRFRRQFANASIHAFEPSLNTFRQLELQTHGDPLSQLNNCALGSKSTELKFYENTHADMNSFLSPGKDHWGTIDNCPTVRVETLDEYCRQNSIRSIDLLKIDTQGYDLEVLRGAEMMLSGSLIRSVLIEITFIEIYQEAPRFDEVLGYLLDRKFRLISLYEVVYRNNAIAWADALLVLA